MQVAAPGAVNRVLGIRDTAATGALMQSVGYQELAVGTALLARPHTPTLLWVRMAGDAAHLALLARVSRDSRHRRWRSAAAAAAVAGMTLLDLIGAVRLGPANHSGRGRLASHSTVTVHRPPDEVYQYWRDLEHLPRFVHHLTSVRTGDADRSHWVARAPGGKVEWDAKIVREERGRLLAWRTLPGADVPNAGAVRLAPAPGGAGTEVAVDLTYTLPGGRAGAAVATLLGWEPQQQVADALRRFKQVVEAGEVVRSDGSPEGTLTRRQFRQRAAQPAR